MARVWLQPAAVSGLGARCRESRKEGEMTEDEGRRTEEEGGRRNEGE
jgi:hypothetical protein